MVSLSLLVAALVAYFVVIVLIGYASKRYVDRVSDYLISSRELSWLVIATSMAVIHLSGTTTVGVPTNSYNFGIGAFTWVIGWPIAILAVAFILGPFWRRTGANTLPEWIAMSYDQRTRRITAWPQVIGIPFSAAAQIVAAAILFSTLTGLPLWVSASIAAAAAMIYMWFGGLWAVSLTDVLQWVVGIFGFLAASAYLLLRYGDVDYLVANLPEAHFQYVNDSFPIGIIDGNFGLVTFFGIMWLMILVIWPSNYYWLRSISSRSETELRKSLIGTFVLVAFVMGLHPLLLGLYGRAVFPDIPAGSVTGAWIEALPAIAAVPLFVLIFAAILSTVDSAAIGASATFIRDIWGVSGEEGTEEATVRNARIITTAILGFVLLISIASMYVAGFGPWLTLGLYVAAVGSVFPAMLFSMFLPEKWAPKEAAFFSVLIGLIVVVYQILGQYVPSIVFGIWASVHPMYTGPAIAAVVFVLVAVIRQFTDPWWEDDYEPLPGEAVADGGHRSPRDEINMATIKHLRRKQDEERAERLIASVRTQLARLRRAVTGVDE